jgi:ribosome-associated heat shock protein Hsp15
MVGIDASARPAETRDQITRIARQTARLIGVERELGDGEIELDKRTVLLTRLPRPPTACPARKTSGWAQPVSAYRVTVWRVAGDQAGRVDSWIWSVRLAATRSAASGACRAGHVRVNGVRVKPAHAVRAGDEVRLRGGERERVVIVQQVITKRVSASAAAACYIDNSPPPPPRQEAVPVAARDRGAGRPTKRERRSIEKLLGRRAR